MICEYCGKNRATNVRTLRTLRGEAMVTKKFHRCDGCRKVHIKALVIGHIAALLLFSGVTVPTIFYGEVFAELMLSSNLPASMNSCLRIGIFFVSIVLPVIAYAAAISVYQRKFHPGVAPPLLGA